MCQRSGSGLSIKRGTSIQHSDICSDRLTILLFLCCIAGACTFCTAQPPVPIPEPIAAGGQDLFMSVESHYDRLIHYSLDVAGSTRSGAWASSIDARTNEPADAEFYPDEVNNAAVVFGANCYWDQPAILASYEIGKRSGCKCYPDASDAYIRSYMFLTGTKTGGWYFDNDHYYDFRDDVVKTRKAPARLTMSHVPAWETFWRQDKTATRRQILKLAQDIGVESSPVSISVAVDSISWLRQQANDDSKISTEAQNQMDRLSALIQSRSETLTLKNGAILYASLVRANIVFANRFQSTVEHARALIDWNIPNIDAQLTSKDEHDVQAWCQVAEALMTIHQSEPQKAHSEQVLAICNAICDVISAQAAKGFAQAESFGRAIHLLERASTAFDIPEFRDSAKELGSLATKKLFDKDNGMFRSRIGSMRCDASDGPGWLFLALLYLDDNDPTANSALHF